MILLTLLVLLLCNSPPGQPTTMTLVGNDKVGSLNKVNRDVGSDDVNNAVDTREIISRVRGDLCKI